MFWLKSQYSFNLKIFSGQFAPVAGNRRERGMWGWRDYSSSFLTLGFPDSSVGKESTCSAGDPGLLPGMGRFPGEGKGYPLQYAGLENSMDWIIQGVAKSRTRLSDFHFTFLTSELPGAGRALHLEVTAPVKWLHCPLCVQVLPMPLSLPLQAQGGHGAHCYQPWGTACPFWQFPYCFSSL